MVDKNKQPNKLGILWHKENQKGSAKGKEAKVVKDTGKERGLDHTAGMRQIWVKNSSKNMGRDE